MGTDGVKLSNGRVKRGSGGVKWGTALPHLTFNTMVGLSRVTVGLNGVVVRLSRVAICLNGVVVWLSMVAVGLCKVLVG